MPVLRDILAGAALLIALAPAFASAGNVGLPRTPVMHKGEVCLTRVDRTQGAVVHLDYTIPNNDLCLTADEAPGSRTHQFIAFCRDEPAGYTRPRWLTWSEVQQNIDAGVLPNDGAVPPADVLEGNPRHDGCWWRIVADADRHPISCAAARPGVDWDTSSLAPGAYVVAGYTYEPPLNEWSPRRGVFKIFDGDPDAAPPAVAIATAEAFLWKDQPARLEVCVDAQPGSTLTASWALSTADPQWTVFLADEPVSADTLEIEFLPPPEHAGEYLTVRVEVKDPQGRTAVAHMPGEIISQTIEDPNAGGSSTTDGSAGNSTGDAPFDFCRDNPHADDPPPCATPSEPTEPAGCGCTTAPTPSALLALLFLVPRRSRRRA